MSGSRKQFDWREIHAELERRLAHLDATIEDDAGRVDALLRERSAALAQVPRDRRDQQDLDRAIAFRLGQERYALSLDRAQEVSGLPRVAMVPGAGAAVLGIINWRGDFVFVFDLKVMFGLPADESRIDRRVIVLRGEEPRVALAVDVIEGIVGVEASALQPPDQLRVAHGDLLQGATADAVLVLAEDSLLARISEELRAA
jgi:purine-binding chemotaxis protein CheW